VLIKRSRLIKQILKINPNVAACSNLGGVRSAREAIADYQREINLEPDFFWLIAT
jgi:hypothetical protein